jgi:predicted RNA-binding Zn-ribbon protein involved in translation (DUF1610 family)
VRFFKCANKNCQYIWIPKKGSKDFSCPKCGNVNSVPITGITAYQCKNRNVNGVVLLDVDGSKRELKYTWDEFDSQFEFIDTDKYWAKKII